MIRQLFWCASLIVLVLALPPTGDWDVDFAGLWSKLRHTGAFALLTALGLAAYREHPRRLVVGLVALAVLIELVQSLAPWQLADISDLLAKLVGITMVRVFFAVVFRR